MTFINAADPRRDAAVPANTPFTRRHLLRGLGATAGLTIFWSSRALAQDAVEPTPVVGEPIASPASEPPPDRPQAPSAVDAYLRVNQDGTVTLLTGKVEFGQGIMTGFAQIVAEELSLPFERVEVIMGQTDVAPYDIGTFGSLSTRQTGPRLWQAAAAMRDWLLELGAEELGHNVSEVELRDGAVIVRDDASSSVAFADIAAGRSVERELDPGVSLKDPTAFTTRSTALEPLASMPRRREWSTAACSIPPRSGRRWSRSISPRPRRCPASSVWSMRVILWH